MCFIDNRFRYLISYYRQISFFKCICENGTNFEYLIYSLWVQIWTWNKKKKKRKNMHRKKTDAMLWNKRLNRNRWISSIAMWLWVVRSRLFFLWKLILCTLTLHWIQHEMKHVFEKKVIQQFLFLVHLYFSIWRVVSSSSNVNNLIRMIGSTHLFCLVSITRIRISTRHNQQKSTPILSL